MKTHELLAPAGNMECLKQAVYNGADAVYLGCKNFGARKSASNFTNDEIIEALINNIEIIEVTNGVKERLQNINH